MKNNKEIIIDPRYNGPPDSGNGGYVSGPLTREFEDIVSVRLYMPPPLGERLLLEWEDDTLVLRKGDEVVAKASSSDMSMVIPEPPAYDEAREAMEHYAGFVQHSFPQCFVCGPKRPDSSGLHIFAGPLKDGSQVASVFTPEDDLLDESGDLAIPFHWAALDCPGSYAIVDRLGYKKLVLGTITGEVVCPAKRDEDLIVTAWYIGDEGRKNYSGSALFNRRGDLKAYARAVWIELRG